MIGIGAPQILVYFSGERDVHWGYLLLTHSHMATSSGRNTALAPWVLSFPEVPVCTIRLYSRGPDRAVFALACWTIACLAAAWSVSPLAGVSERSVLSGVPSCKGFPLGNSPIVRYASFCPVGLLEGNNRTINLEPDWRQPVDYFPEGTRTLRVALETDGFASIRFLSRRPFFGLRSWAGRDSTSERALMSVRVMDLGEHHLGGDSRPPAALEVGSLVKFLAPYKYPDRPPLKYPDPTA